MGFIYLLYRVVLTGNIAYKTFKLVRVGVVAPFLMWGACASNLLFGQWGAPSNQGFAVFVAGVLIAFISHEISPSRSRLPFYNCFFYCKSHSKDIINR